MKEDFIKLDSVETYNKLFGLESLHPLVNVIDLDEATYFPTHFTINYGIYALFLKDTRCGDIRYGKQTYDYQDGTIVSFAPGQVAETELQKGVKPKAKGLLFHPDLIKVRHSDKKSNHIHSLHIVRTKHYTSRMKNKTPSLTA